MMSNNGLMTYKNKWISFINKDAITALLVLVLIVIAPFSFLLFAYWSEVPIFIKIIWPILLTVVFVGIITTPLNGMIITKKGVILFLPDFRLKKFNIKDLERIAIVFNEWENNKYSATVKFVYGNGDIFIKDYSRQFRSMQNKKMAMSMYTITKTKVDKICNKLLDLNVCIITIIDKDKKIVYQTK